MSKISFLRNPRKYLRTHQIHNDVLSRHLHHTEAKKDNILKYEVDKFKRVLSLLPRMDMENDKECLVTSRNVLYIN